MAPNLQHLLDKLYLSIRYRRFGIICQTYVYGMYFCVVSIAVYVMITNGLRTRSRKWFLAMITSMFALSTVYWITSVIVNYHIIDSWNIIFRECNGRHNVSVCVVDRMPRARWLAMFGTILFVNYIIADGIVVWRAWVLCSDQSRVVLMIPVVILTINTIVYFMTIAVRAALLTSLDGTRMHYTLIHMINGTQLVHLTISLLTNIVATSIIALKAWKYRKLLVECGTGVRTPTRGIRILAILIESGMIYILIGVMAFTALAILFFLHLNHGALNNVFIPVCTQLVGIYPIVVVLLVEQNRSLDSRFCSFATIGEIRGSTFTNRIHELRTASGTRTCFRDQIDLAPKPPNIGMHPTDHRAPVVTVCPGPRNATTSANGSPYLHSLSSPLDHIYPGH